jgi:hypothetical protein
MAAPENNKNSNTDNRLWANTIRRAVTQADPDRLRRIAERLLDQAEEGNIVAMKEIGDRLDGKAAQVLAGDPDNPLTVISKIERLIVDPANTDSQGI